MAISPRRRLAAGATGLLVLAGAGGAYAATQTSPTKPDPAAEQKAFLDDVAGRLNVTPDKLQAALKGAAEDRIDAAVAAGGGGEGGGGRGGGGGREGRRRAPAA